MSGWMLTLSCFQTILSPPHTRSSAHSVPTWCSSRGGSCTRPTVRGAGSKFAYGLSVTRAVALIEGVVDRQRRTDQHFQRGIRLGPDPDRQPRTGQDLD